MSFVMAEIRPSVEYPMQDEKIVSPAYTLRIGAPAGAEAVDVSIDQGEWRPCRPASGFWWYDWSGYEDGEHEAVARTRGHGGRWLVSEPHEFMVATAPPAERDLGSVD